MHEVAGRLGTTVSTVRVWLSRGRFPGARKEQSPAGEYWMIPESALDGFEMRKPGPKPGAKKPTAKKAKSK
ncbi:MAG TPA: helix-turn-helix domain-containing protein [Blastocatellia bacterium]|nr:helix-turn-helix domain-containing protein [Blastocatellia bacterium]